MSPSTRIQAWALLSNRTRQLTESMSPIDITFKRCSHSNSHKTVFIVYPFASGLLGIFFLAFARLDRGFLSFVLAQQFHGFATRQSSCIFQMQKTRKTTPMSFGRVPTTLLGILASRLGIPLGVLTQGQIMLKKANFARN